MSRSLFLSLATEPILAALDWHHQQQGRETNSLHASYFNRYRLSVDLFAFVEDSPLTLRLYVPFRLE